MDCKGFCFITPPTTRPQDDIFFPMGPVVLGTLLKTLGIPVQILDFDLMFRKNPELGRDRDLYWDTVLRKVKASGADVFGISSICSNFPNALQLAKFLREHFPQAKIILGGPQPSSVPKRTLEVFPYVDAIVVGEGERTLKELMGSPWSEESLKNISGLCFRWGEKIHLTPSRPLIDDLDELPMPDFSLVDFQAYQEITPHMAVVEAGRGCPFRCTFCSTAEFWSRKYRAKSPARILEEMKRVNNEYGMDYFCLTHDNFTTSPKYVREFCSYMAEHNPGLTWASSARTDTLKKDDLKKMYEAGCRVLFFGVDSGSDKTQKEIDKNLNLIGYKEILLEAIHQGIKPTSSFVIGFPEERPEDLAATIQLGLWSLKAGAKDIQFHRLSPLSSTKIYRDHAEDIFLKPIATDMSFQVHADDEIVQWMTRYPELFSSFYSIPTPHLDGIELLDFSSFYNVIGNQFGPILYKLMERQDKTPLDLYQEWNEYAQKHYPPNSIYDGNRTADFYRQTFSDFI